MVSTLERAQAFIDRPVRAIGAFSSDVRALVGDMPPVGFLAGPAALPPRLLLAVTDGTICALEPGQGWRPRRLLASWRRDEVGVLRRGRALVLSVPGSWTLRLAPLGEPGRHVVELLCGYAEPRLQATG